MTIGTVYQGVDIIESFLKLDFQGFPVLIELNALIIIVLQEIARQIPYIIELPTLLYSKRCIIPPISSVNYTFSCS